MLGRDSLEQEGAVVITNVYGDFCVRKTRRKRQKKLVQEMFYEYATNTTLHGLAYTTKRGLTIIEKTFWLITFIGSICLCCYLINNVWIKWKESPVIVTVSEQLVSVGKVPFPSVTICPQLKSKTSLYNYTNAYFKFKGLKKDDNLKAVNPEEFAIFSDISNICIANAWFHDEFDVIINKYNFSATRSNVANNIIRVAPNKSDVFQKCTWGEESDLLCNYTVSEVLTSEGLCFNINSLSANEILRLENIHKDYPYLTANKPIRNWSLEHGYTSYGPMVYPAAGKEFGASPDLEVLMKDYSKEHDGICNGIHSGFKVYVQHPADLPRSSLYYYAVINNHISSMALSFSILNTSETLRSYSPDIRQCYFPEERYLKYFKIYTANNCRIECLSNFTYELCGCVGFYMPHDGSNETCTAVKADCIKNAIEALREKTYNKKDECLCLPACNSVDYEAVVLKTEYNLKNLFKATLHDSIMEGANVSKLEMYFKRPQFLSMRRSELFGLTDFLANIGGLLGLFLGFSFLSLIELFYFATLRLCCILKKDLKQEKLSRTNTIRVPSSNRPRTIRPLP